MIREAVGDARIVFDVGAKYGICSLEYLAAFPKTLVYAFEPAPSNFRWLATVDDPRLRPVQSAVLDCEGTVDFHLSSHAGSHSILGIDQMEFPVTETITVPTITLDTFCERENIEHIDFLKIDTQGADLRVLMGATQLFESDRVGVMEVELIYYPYYKEQATPKDISGFLHRFGMQMIALFPHYYQGSRRYANAVFSK